ncbi:hypothetical protein I4U23_021164 [Adineta vaga]|nr:hypothetical protein I4U23_021164 [Adineta vaga]
MAARIAHVIKVDIAEGPHPLRNRMGGLAQAGEALHVLIKQNYVLQLTMPVLIARKALKDWGSNRTLTATRYRMSLADLYYDV